MESSMFDIFYNYSYINNNSLYNLLIITLKSLNEQQQIDFIENIKLNLGLSWFHAFKNYTLRKLPLGHYVTKLLN